ncbi:MAG: hypothetical protein AAB497_03680 [Patescibacteria group bacterium]
MQDLVEFAKRTGFHPNTIKRVLRFDDNPVPSRMIPLVYRSDSERTPIEMDASLSLAEKARERYFKARGHINKCGTLRAWISLCATREEITEAYHATEDGSAEELFALKILNEIFMRDLEKSSAMEEVLSICGETPRESGIERSAFLKLYELYKYEQKGGSSERALHALHP